MKKQSYLEPAKAKNEKTMNLNRDDSLKYSSVNSANMVNSSEYLSVASDSGIQSADTYSEYGAMSDSDRLSDIADARSITPSSYIPFNYNDAQEELLLNEKDLVDELVAERIIFINIQLEDANIQLQQQKQEAEDYKQLYEQLLMMVSSIL